ncbi:MAG: zinc-dependent metalloprotease [Pseudobdellovibrionaceae bacterium]
MTQKSQFAKALTALISFALVATGCTKKRDAALPDSDVPQTFAIDEFGSPSSSGFSVAVKASLKDKAAIQSYKASTQKGLVSIDSESSSIPKRLQFMFDGLEVSGQENQDFKIVFGVDAKFVTAYKLTSNLNSLSALEKQIAKSASEVQLSIDLQKTKEEKAKKEIVGKIAAAQKNLVTSLASNANVNVLVPIFKYEIQKKGVLERTTNELHESTSTLTLRETDLAEATHISIKTLSEARKDIGADQSDELDQVYTTDSLDNQISTAAELQKRFNIEMKFVANDSKVLTKLDASDMKVYEMTTLSKLSGDEQRLVKTNRAGGEILNCSDAAVESQDKNCVLRLVAKVPVTYKNANLKPVDGKSYSDSTIELKQVTKSESQGLVEIARQVHAERARPTGLIDPQSTIKISDLQGEFYFRRTFEDASNMMVVGQTGTSGDMAVVKFELENDRVVVRNQKALIQYIGQGPKDKEELASVPVKYFILETSDADGSPLQVPRLVPSTKEEAQYIEIDWTQNSVPVANSPLAFFEVGTCWVAGSSQQVTDMDMRLEKDGMLNFSLAASYSVRPECANQANDHAQFNYNVVERLSFKKRTNAAVEDIQFAPNIPLKAQSAMNFAIFTMSDQVTTGDVHPGREGSQINHPIIHDFRNGKVLNYWVGGLTKSPKERRALIEQAAKEVVDEWNQAFHKAFAGTELDRSGDYVVLNTEDDATRGHLGDLDRNYLWFMDMPAQNGLLGVAQFAPNPYSGTIIANNVIVYSGNSETEVHSFLDSYKESRKYEKLLESAKTQALAEFQKQMEQEKKSSASAATGAAATAPAAGQGAAEQVTSMTKNFESYIKKLALSARPAVMQRMSSNLTSSAEAINAIKGRMKNGLAGKTIKGRTVVSDVQIDSNKDFTRHVLQQALSEDFKNDPVMLEAIIARELARTEQGLSPEIKDLLVQQSKAKEMSAKFKKAAELRGGCFLFSRGEYNDKFIETDFNTLFKKEIKETLLHEVGHSLGLRHNFKASFDKENFSFEGEKTNRNYTSIMDYIASPEIEYDGPGTYDVHALRAIYTGYIEASEQAKELAHKSGGVIANKNKVSATLFQDKYLKLDDVKNLLGFQTWAEMQKQLINKSSLLKHYYQCHDELVGIEPACTRYDEGASASEIVRNQIQNYHRMYATAYHASDRMNFGWPQKVAVIRRAIETFRTVRGFLDDYFKMVIYGSALNEDELADFREASLLGYDFFHEVIRIPDTNLPFGSTPEDIAKRLTPIPYVLKTPVVNDDGEAVMDAQGNPQFKETKDIKILEARRLYDYTPAPTGDRIDTLGIGYDKQFALQFLLSANPAALTDDSHTGWIGYNEFEQYFLGVRNAAQSTNMLTLLEIITGDLKVGFMDSNHTLQTVNMPVKVNRNLLDTATLRGLVDTNQYRSEGLDTFADFFKIGTIKGGNSIKDRLMATRYGQNSKSAAAIKFFAADNAVGANLLIAKAARKGTILENKVAIGKSMAALLSADMTLTGKIIEAVAADESLKNKDRATIIAGNADLKKLSDTADQAAADLVKILSDLNINDVLVTKDEITANPNLALDKQVMLLRGMMVKSITYFNAIKPLLEKMPLDQLEEAFKQMQIAKQTNASLATIDLLALGQEILVESVASDKITLKDGRVISAQVVMGLLMETSPLTGSQESLMYGIEDLARFTSLLNPEYVY